MLAEDIEDILAGRFPHHRAGWIMPPPGDRTIASGRLEEPAVGEELQLIDEDLPIRSGRRRPAATLVALLSVAVTAYFYFHPADRLLWRAMLETPPVVAVALMADELSSALRSVLESKPDAPPPLAVRSSPPPAASLSPEALAMPKAFDPPEPIFGDQLPSLWPARTEAPLQAEAPAVPAGHLVVELEHHIRRGRLQMWVDDQSVLDQDFDGRVVRRFLSMELRKGVVQESLALDPGRHAVRVQVSWEKNVKSSRISGTFPPGATRRLDVSVGRFRGNLSLAWR
jgi:hypothetical protein